METRFQLRRDKRLVGTGEMGYTSTDRLEARALTPKPELMLLERESLMLERDQRRMRIHLRIHPEVLALVASVRGRVASDRASMERNYLMQLEGAAVRWMLTLHPKDADIAALIQRITVTAAQIRTIEYRQADGDRSVLAIEPAKP